MPLSLIRPPLHADLPDRSSLPLLRAPSILDPQANRCIYEFWKTQKVVPDPLSPVPQDAGPLEAPASKEVGHPENLFPSSLPSGLFLGRP